MIKKCRPGIDKTLMDARQIENMIQHDWRCSNQAKSCKRRGGNRVEFQMPLSDFKWENPETER